MVHCSESLDFKRELNVLVNEGQIHKGDAAS